MEQKVICFNTLTERLEEKYSIDIHEVPMKDGKSGNFWHLMHALVKDQLRHDTESTVQTFTLNLKEVFLVRHELIPGLKEMCLQESELGQAYYDERVADLELENQLEWRLKVISAIVELEPHLVESDYMMTFKVDF